MKKGHLNSTYLTPKAYHSPAKKKSKPQCRARQDLITRGKEIVLPTIFGKVTRTLLGARTSTSSMRPSWISRFPKANELTLSLRV